MNNMNISNYIDSFANAINSLLLEIDLSDDDYDLSSDDNIYDDNDIFLNQEDNKKKNYNLEKKDIKFLNNLNLKKEKFCSISQEKFEGNAIKLPCKHIFKREPIINYLIKYNNKCPVCRGEISVNDLKEIYLKKKKVLKSLIKKRKKELKIIRENKNKKYKVKYKKKK